MKVRLAPKVVDFVRSLPPEPRRRLRLALRDLARGKGDVKALERPLHEYCRLRVGSYRVIVSYHRSRGIDCASIAYSRSAGASCTKSSPIG